MADAGILRIKNPKWSMQRCLETAGYSAATARCQKRNQLTATQCIEEAWKREPTAAPRDLLQKARKLLNKRLDVSLTQDLADVKLTEVARLVDTVERSYGASELDVASDARGFAARLKWLQTVAAELQTRDEPVVLDAEVIED